MEVSLKLPTILCWLLFERRRVLVRAFKFFGKWKAAERANIHLIQTMAVYKRKAPRKAPRKKWEYPLGTRTHIIFNDIAQFQHHKGTNGIIKDFFKLDGWQGGGEEDIFRHVIKILH